MGACLGRQLATQLPPCRVFDEYDIPLQGVIAQDGCFYLFDCVAGRMTRPGIWMYTHIQSDELAALDATEGKDFDDLVLRIQASHPAKIAASIRGEGLIAEVDAWDIPEGLREALGLLANAVRDWAQHIAESTDELGRLGSSPAWERMVAAG